MIEQPPNKQVPMTKNRPFQAISSQRKAVWLNQKKFPMTLK